MKKAKLDCDGEHKLLPLIEKMVKLMPDMRDYVVFYSGTCVSMGCRDGHKPIYNFLGTNQEGQILDRFLFTQFPSARFAGTDTTYESNKLENQLCMGPVMSSPFRKQSAQAYGCLMWSGYPKTKSWVNNKRIYRVNNQYGYGLFMEMGDRCCWTMYDLEREVVDVDQHVKEADKIMSKARRLDYLYPCPYAYVDANGTISVI
jgi:hypothetical protein